MQSNNFTSNSLLILTWNSNGLINRKNELLATLQNSRIDIALISEIHLTNVTKINLPGYHIIQSNHPDDTPHAGAAICIRSSLLYYPLPQYQTAHIQACGITLILNHIPINIYAIYSPPRHSITTTLFRHFFNTLGQKFIIGDDLNAKNLQWGCRVNNPRGNTLYNLLQQNNYKILAPDSPSYWPASLRKRPDILDIFVTKIPNSLHSTLTNLNDLCSDHSAVLFTLDATPSKKPSKPSLIRGRMDWEAFRTQLVNHIDLKTRLKSRQDIDDAVNNLTTSIQQAAWSSSIIPDPLKPTYNLPHFVRTLISKKRKARAVWQRTKYPSDKRLFNHLTNKLKRILAKIKSDNLTNHLTSLSATDNSLWQSTRKILRSQHSVPPLRNPDGTWLISDLEKANAFRHHLHSTFQPHINIIPHNKIVEINHFLSNPLPITLPPKHIRPSEIEFIISKSARHKTPGYDLITSEVASQLPKKAILSLTHIYNSMLRLSYFPLLWKFSVIIMILKPGKSADSPSSYRPISLLPSSPKYLKNSHSNGSSQSSTQASQTINSASVVTIPPYTRCNE